MAGIIAARKLSGNVAVNLNYRIDKLDIFGSAYYYQRQNRQNITREHSITQNSVFKVDENIGQVIYTTSRDPTEIEVAAGEKAVDVLVLIRPMISRGYPHLVVTL